LNRLPKVKIFIAEYTPQFPKVEVKYIPGADPEMVFLTDKDEEVDRVDIAEMSPKKIVDLLASYNIHKEESANIDDVFEDLHEDEEDDEEHEELIRHAEDHEDLHRPADEL